MEQRRMDAKTKTTHLTEDYEEELLDDDRSLSPEDFVKNIMDEASRVPCDETLSDFNKTHLPDYYDPVKIKRAHQFFDQNVFALYVNKMLGLIITLASPSILKILQMTKMSGCIMTAYKRYVATLLHMNIWYQDDLTGDSSAMQSIKIVKSMHNAASKQARSKGLSFITQKDMVLTQFGFMGFAISRSEMVGIHNASKEDLECFIHFWRVIGHIMGIQDRFNLCRTTLEETRDICDELIEKILRPSLEERNTDFLKMSSYMINGLWNINPALNFRCFVSYLHEVLKPKYSNNNEEKRTTNDLTTYFELNFWETLHFKFISLVFSLMRFSILRIYLNYQQFLAFWIIKRYPFLAVYNFGYENAMVSIKLPNAKAHIS
ncbi:hypothetical protein WA026_019095 [Henosepilachna vigintioctopunctata]|uniref:ER-bound oxygenase mpaB/mpaB'/Rubber oxygenase catalytic domain-containing protein n=1 Tax=Henosepilachna vigintioctopunctata TaxID=420089 RepID=A0AAW1VF05_9CUCU